MLLNERLKQLRLQYNYTQENVAQKIGVSKQSVSKWESGKTYPDIDNLIILSDIYNVTIDELIREDSILKKRIKIKKKNRVVDFLGGSLVFVLFYVIKEVLITQRSPLQFSSLKDFIISSVILVTIWIITAVIFWLIVNLGSTVKERLLKN
ncbi:MULTISPECIES: helix-turn-helix domain-containing protein [Bacillus]|uniref:helix-turn-helix domain-containing protein n=2 Tax=Bacillaceae TaxID=186817 RepID=UPI0003C3364B|nr:MULTISPECIES: helix-turn-helix transcriptional regulator [Bacillus cereus group]AHA10948.1 Transcriptional regulator, XRE family [Bacillus toyonensis BCT-7112]AIK35222.1 helix-turn-helix family protein [Bacillus pseudomycoides]AJI14437.1 helix-turn-helix family protein [Bacillus pseudomycoides]MCU4830757.1 helix-turn-helix domain-containing protein [Bacillus toyonensis]MED4714655.1 helix-turn-helix transcriptional regulator [Bacillus pseudomycoides]